MDSRKLALLCRELADNKKAEDITILDVRKLSSVTDYFVIASGTSEPHLRAIVDEITDRLRDEHGVRAKAVDGTLKAAWVVLDYLRCDRPRHARGREGAIRFGGALGRCAARQAAQAAQASLPDAAQR